MRGPAVLLLLASCGFSVAGGSAPTDGKVNDAPTGGTGDAAGGTDGAIAAADAAMIDAPPPCPTSFSQVQGAPVTSRYQVFAKADQLTALATCSGMGTHLLRVDSTAEATALEAFLDAQTADPQDTHRYRVVGARDLVIRSIWHDLDLSVMQFLPWGQGEPTSGLGEDCIVLKQESGAGVIGADQCGTAHEFACECE